METVLFVNHLRRGSASSYRQEGFAACLSRRGFRTALICPRGHGTGSNSFPAPFDEVSFFSEPFPMNLASNSAKLSAAMRRANVIHVNRASPYTASLLMMPGHPHRRALVVDMEDLDGYGGYSSYVGSYGPKGWALTAFEKVFPRRAGAVLAVSRLLRTNMLRSGVREDRIFIVPNGYDAKMFRPEIDADAAKREFGVSDHPVVMYSSTYWSFEKAQHMTALTAFKLISERVPGARLLMTGRLTPEIVAMLQALGIEDRVVRTGFVPRSSMPVVMAAADIAIHVISGHPFHVASSPMIVPEYLAMGKPVVAPMIGELVAMLGGGAGVLVPRSDPKLLADAAVELLRDRSLRMRVGASASARASQTYSYDAETETLVEAYERAVSSAH